MTSETPRQGPNGYKAESIDTFLEVLQRRRSIRTGFLRDEPVPDDLIEKILEAARWAPSAGNSQPWEFLVVRDLESREKIVEIFKTQMRDKIEIEEATRGQRRRVNAGDIRRMVLRDGMWPGTIGMILGLAGSLAVNRILRSQLVGLSPYDPVTMAGAPVVLILVALLACLIPARRAMRVDPAIALRHE